MSLIKTVLCCRATLPLFVLIYMQGYMIISVYTLLRKWLSAQASVYTRLYNYMVSR